TAQLKALELAAAAVELIHAYSLVHDDLPCMDDDELRRGRPTVHIQFDEACAMLAGDALQPLAFELLAQMPIAPALVVQAISQLARAAGSAGMAGGQAFQVVDDILDVTAVTATLGKTAGKDAADNKPTYVSILGLEGSRELLGALNEKAQLALRPVGPSAARLTQLADYIVGRDR